MIAVAEHCLCIDAFQLFHRKEANLTLCPDTHKGRGFDITVRCMNDTGTTERSGNFIRDLKAEAIVVLILLHTALQVACDPSLKRR